MASNIVHRWLREHSQGTLQMRIIALAATSFEYSLVFAETSFSLHSVPTFTRYWSTSASNPKHCASPRHAVRRCGKVKVRRRRGRVWRLSQTGICQPDHRPITATISALPGEFAAMGDASRRLCRGRAVSVGSPVRGWR